MTNRDELPSDAQDYILEMEQATTPPEGKAWYLTRDNDITCVGMFTPKGAEHLATIGYRIDLVVVMPVATYAANKFSRITAKAERKWWQTWG